MAYTYLSENFSDISDWTNDSTAPCTATVSTGGGRTYCTLYSGATTSYPYSASINRTLTTTPPPTKFTMEFVLNHAKLGTGANYDHFGLTLQGSTWVALACASNQVGVSNTNIGDLAIHDGSTWQTWRLEVKNQSIWVFLEDVFIQRVETLPYGTAGLVTISQLGWTTAACKTYIDSFTITSSGGIAKSLIF